MTSSLQSGSMRSAGFSPLSFSASVLAPFDRRYLCKTGEKTMLPMDFASKDHRWIYNTPVPVCRLVRQETSKKTYTIRHLVFLPCYFWIAVAAGHVKRRPAILIPLMNICTIFYKQLHHLQVPSQHSFMKRCHACPSNNTTSHQIIALPLLQSFIFKLS